MDGNPDNEESDDQDNKGDEEHEEGTDDHSEERNNHTNNSGRWLETIGGSKKSTVTQFAAENSPNTYEDRNIDTGNHVTTLQEEPSPNRKPRLSLPPILY